MNTVLSVLVCSVYERLGKSPVIDKLFEQARGLPVEILVLTDDRTRSIGSKRNSLMQAAKGEFISFVDDDDDVSDDYCSSAVSAIKSSEDDIDVVCFHLDYVRLGVKKWTVEHSLAYEDESVNVNKSYDRLIRNSPRHTSIVRRSIATKLPFKDSSYGEDSDWGRRLKKLAKSEAIIPRSLYVYLDNPKTSIARQYAAPTSGAYREWKDSQ